MRKKKMKMEKESWFDPLKRKISDFLYGISCWFHRKTQREKNKQNKSLKGNVINRNIFLFCVLAIPVLNFIIYYVIVNINSILMSLQYYDLNSGRYLFLTADQGGLFANFKAFAKDMTGSFFLRFAHKNSFKLYFIGLFITMPIQVFTSFFIYKKIPGTGFEMNPKV